MGSPRTRSENRAVRGYGFPKDSKKSPNGFRGNWNPGRDGKGRGSGFDYAAFAAKHFPDEHPELAATATWQVHASHHKRKDPDPVEVAQMLEEMGWSRAQREGA